MACLEYVKAIEQNLGRPIQDMIDWRAETIDRMLTEWRMLIPPPHAGYQEEGIQALEKGKGKQRASPVKEDVINVEDDIEGVCHRASFSRSLLFFFTSLFLPSIQLPHYPSRFTHSRPTTRQSNTIILVH